MKAHLKYLILFILCRCHIGIKTSSLSSSLVAISTVPDFENLSASQYIHSAARTKAKLRKDIQIILTGSGEPPERCLRRFMEEKRRQYPLAHILVCASF